MAYRTRGWPTAPPSGPARRGDRLAAWTGGWAALLDLVLPTECAGCRGTGLPLRAGACPDCVAVLRRLRPVPVRPTPAPAGFPDCQALGEYHGELREVLLAYKERGRHGLARPLGELLAEVVASAADSVATTEPGDPAGLAGTGAGPILLVPVPATARSARARHGDHLLRLTRHAARRLRSAGWPVLVARWPRARPRPDSSSLSGADRIAVANTAFRLSERRARVLRRLAAGRAVVLLDDIVTTGATLSAMAGVLSAAGVPVDAAAVLAATRRRR